MRSFVAVILIAIVIGVGLFVTTDRARENPLVAKEAPPRSTRAAPTAATYDANPPTTNTPAVEAVAEDEAMPLVRRDSAFQGVFFAAERGLTNLEEQLAAAQAAIAAGSVEAQFDLARIAANCEVAEELTALIEAPANDGSSFSLQAESIQNSSGEWAVEIERVASECAPVLEARPAGLSTVDWQVQALRQAAEQGHPLAQLELALEHDAATATYSEVLELVQTAVQSDDYRAYFLAADFLNEFHDPAGADVNEARAMQWFYLGCRHSPYCEPSILEAQLALDYTPAQIDGFKVFADDAESAMTNAQPLRFEAGWLGLNTDLNASPNGGAG